MKARASWPMKDWEVLAILDGRKTQHRMPVKQKLTPLAEGSNWYQFDHRGLNYRVNARHTTVGAFAQLLQFHPHGQPGDRLWGREKHAPQADCWGAWERMMAAHANGPSFKGPNPIIAYAADKEPHPFIDRWRPSIHMPEWASRITLEIVSVRVERLQDISADDARAEGCPDKPVHGAEQASVDAFARQWYGDLWEQINGPGSWDANPWCWVVEFKRVTQEGGAND